MKRKLSLVASLFLLGLSAPLLAIPLNHQPLAAPGSTQFVTIMNNLHNPNALNHTQSDITVNYYDGAGNLICWTEEKIAFRSDPNVAGAGGKNGCGKPNTKPAAIVKIDVKPRATSVGKVYEDLTGVSIDSNKFYITILVEQDKAPEYYRDGSLKSPGTIKIRQFLNNE
jgi:hypothetical protein